MRVIEEALNGVLLLEPKVFGDSRGFFFESYNANAIEKLTGFGSDSFVQDNHSRSEKGVLRGIHYQLAPFAQGKLVRVSEGAVFDVAVDLRRSSPAFGQWYGAKLSGENHRQLWVPPGFGHGFLTLSKQAHFLYKTTAYYSQSDERAIRWNDVELAIDWPLDGVKVLLSEKDGLASDLSNAEVFE